MKTCVNSEIGKLEGVILHTPGSEVENMTPENAERALYSDILNLTIASKEYQQLQGILNKITQTFQVKDLLSEALKDNEVKSELVKKVCEIEQLEYLTDELLEQQPMQLATSLIEGVPIKKHNLTNYLSEDRFVLRPLHNLFFTRDASMAVNDQILIGKMANPVRDRESMIMDTIFNNRSIFETTTLNPNNPTTKLPVSSKIKIEGGDFEVAREDIFVIGTGMRTSSQGIDYVIEQIKARKTQCHHIIVQELPDSPESFIHLDMIFTFLNKNECMVYEPVILGTKRYRTIHIKIENGKVTKINEEDDILSALTKLGMNLKAVSCGGKDDSWVQEREQWHSGANFFAFAPGKVIGYERNSNTIEALNKNGYEVLRAQEVIEGIKHPDNYAKCIIAISGSELARGGGGARCMTMPFKRQKVSW